MKDKVLFVAILGLAITGVSFAIADPFDLPLVYAQVTNSTSTNSTSTITNSTITNSTITNSTIIDSTIIDSISTENVLKNFELPDFPNYKIDVFQDYTNINYLNGTYSYIYHRPYIEDINGLFVPYTLDDQGSKITVESFNYKLEFDENNKSVVFYDGQGQTSIKDDSYLVRTAEVNTDDWFFLEVNNADAELIVELDEEDEETVYVTIRRQNDEGIFDIVYEMNDLVKVTAKFTNLQYPNHKFAFTETLNLNTNIIELNEQVIDLNEFVGQTFPREVLIENQDFVIKVQESYYYSGVGFENLWSVGIFDGNRIALDYANVQETQTEIGQTVELDPTYNPSGVVTFMLGDPYAQTGGGTPSSTYATIIYALSRGQWEFWTNSGQGYMSVASNWHSIQHFDFRSFPVDPSNITNIALKYRASNTFSNQSMNLKDVNLAQCTNYASQIYSGISGGTTLQSVTLSGSYPNFYTMASFSSGTHYDAIVDSINNDETFCLGFQYTGGTMAFQSVYYDVTYTVPPPDEPTGLSITQDTNGELDLSWSAPASGTTPTGYKIERSLDNSSWTTLTTDTGSTSTTYTDTTASDVNTTYYYRVYSYYSPTATYSSLSTSASGTTWDYPNPPTNVQTVNGIPVGVSWTAPTSVDGTISGYKVYRSTFGSHGTQLPNNGGTTPVDFTDNELLLHGESFYGVNRDSTYDGTNNGATTGVTGVIDNAWSFDGSSSYVTIGSTSTFQSFHNNNGVFTIAGWFKQNGANTSTDFILTNTNTGANQDGFDISITDGSTGGYNKIQFGSQFSSTEIIPISSTSWHDNALSDSDTDWHFFAVKWQDNVEYCTFVDSNKKCGTPNDSTTTSASYSSLKLGSTATANGNFFNGAIDNLVIYNRYLSDSEITSLYNSGVGTNTPNTTNLLAYYDFEQTGSTLESQTFLSQATPDNSPNTLTVTANSGTTTTGVFDNGISTPNLEVTSSLLPDGTDSFTIGSWVKQVFPEADFFDDFADNTSWTQAGSPNTEIVHDYTTDDRIEFTNQRDSFLYKSIGTTLSDQFVIDFTHSLTSNPNVGSRYMLFEVTAGTSEPRSSTQDALGVIVGGASQNLYQLAYKDGSGSWTQSSTTEDILQSETKYLRLIRDGTDWTIEVYTNSDYSDTPYSFTTTIPSTITGLSYAMFGGDSGEVNSWSGWVDNLEIYNGYSSIPTTPTNTKLFGFTNSNGDDVVFNVGTTTADFKVNTTPIISATGLTDNTSNFQHYTLSRDGSSWTLYQNGQSVATATDSTDLGTVSGSHKINIDGSIDEYFIDSTALTSNEVETVYQMANDPTFLSTTGTTPSYNDNSGNAGDSYYYYVKTTTDVGDSQTYSTPTVGTFGTPPDPPTGVTTAIQNPDPSPLDVFVQWSAPTNVGTGTLTGFEIYRDGSLVASTGLVSSYTDTVPSAGTYTYTVRAVATHGTSTDSNSSQISTPNPPDAPTTSTAINDPDNLPFDVAVSFTAPASDGGSAITGYNIYSSSDDLSYTLEASNVNTPQIVTVSSAGTWYFKTQAINNVGTGALSSASSINTPSVPDAPPSITLTIDNPDPSPLVVTVSISPPNNGGSAITGYNIYTSSDDVTYSLVGNNVQNPSTVTLANAGLWYFKAEAINNVGTGALSTANLIGTPVEPDAPASVSTSIPDINNAPSTVVISWTAPADNGGSALTGYNVYRDSSLITSVGSTTLTFTDTDVKTVNTQYTYEVKATNNVGEGLGTTSNITTPNTPLAPTLSILSGTTKLTWTTPTSDGTITGYKIYRDSSLIKTTGLVLTYTDMSVLNWSNSYDYEVSAVSTIGEGALSNTVNPTFDTEVDDATAFGTTGTSSIIDWTEPPYFQGNVTSYSVYYSTPYSSNPSTLIGTTANTYLNLYNQLQYDTNYAFMVLVNSPLGNTSVGNVVNATTTENLGIVTYDPTTGANWFDIDAVNQEDLSTTKYTRVDNGDTVLLEIEYPTNYEDMTCDVGFKFGQQTLQYVEGEDMTATALDAEHQAVVMQFNNQGNEVITVECADQNVPNSASSYTVTTTFGNFPLLTQIADFRTGEYGTNGMFGALDLITLFVVIISMVGFNRINPIAGVIMGVSAISGLAYFGVINLPPAIIGIFALLAFLAWGVTRK